MGLKNLENVTYFLLNNEINRPNNGVIPLHKDKEALDAFMKENVEACLMTFDSYEERLNYLIENNYIEEEFIRKYSMDFINELHEWMLSQKFEFHSFMGAYKFYNQFLSIPPNYTVEYFLHQTSHQVYNFLDVHSSRT